MSAYCRCGAKTDLSGPLVEPPIPGEGQVNWWQSCGRCGKPSHAVQDKVRDVRAPAGNNLMPISHVGKANGQSIHRWVKPGEVFVETIEYSTYPRRVRVNSTEPLVFSIWALLMTKVEIILRPPTGPGDNALEADARERARLEGRGIAETLAILMDPFVESANAVVKHAVAKHNDPSYEVPGLGEHLWDPNMNPDGSPRQPVAQPKKKTEARPKPAKAVVNNASTKKLTPEEAEGIREAVGSGMFTKEDVAAMFKVSLATVESALA